MRNEIYLRRKNKVILKKGDSKNSKKVLTTLLKNLESLGFTLSMDVLKVLKTYSISDIDKFHKTTSSILAKMIGANVKYNPMYPNFPKQVMEMSEVELYLNAIIHYITWGEVLPEYEKILRPNLKGKFELKVVELGNVKDFFNMFTDSISSKVAMSPTDKEDLEWFVRQYKEKVLDILPDSITNKENLSYFIGLLKENNLLSDEVTSKYFRTPTDVLRFITAISDGDVSLATNTQFKRIGRADRKLYLKILENCSNLTEDMLRYKNKWIRLGEILHPFEYKRHYPKCFEAFDVIRNNKKVDTFNNQFERFIKNKELSKTVDLLKTRPGEYARRLDRVLRTFINKKQILEGFAQVADRVSTTVLIQVACHFMNRNTAPYRVFFPKGVVSKLQLVPNELDKIHEVACDKVVEICDKALMNSFSEKEPLGNVYVDKKLKDYTVPFALRSASKSLRTISRGSKVKMDAGSTIRMFIHWKNQKGLKGSHYSREDNRVDVDLSAVLYNENWEYMEHVSYTNLKSSNYQACHSGDIINAPKGASEFIDIDKKSAIEYGARYVVMNVLSFTGQPFSEIPECYAGCMIRTSPKSGEVYEPKTVKDKFDLTSESKLTIPLIFDLVENKFIWCDMNIKSRDAWYGNNIESNQTGIIAMGKAMTDLSKPNLYDLFVLHAKSRGKLSTKKDADVIFSVDTGVTPVDIDKITTEYL